MKTLTVKDINKMMWPTWKGAIDDIALKERIEELLLHEKQLIDLQKQIQMVKEFFVPKERGV